MIYVSLAADVVGSHTVVGQREAAANMLARGGSSVLQKCFPLIILMIGGVPPYAGNQLRRGSDCTTGPGTESRRRPTTCPPSMIAGQSWIGSAKRERASTFLIAAFSCRLVLL